MINKRHPCHKNTEETVGPDDNLIEQKTLQKKTWKSRNWYFEIMLL